MAAANLNELLRWLTRGLAAEMPGDQSDQHLVERALAARDEAAFQAIVHRHGPMVYRVCWRVLQHSQDAEDAFQATFLVLAQNLRSLRQHASLASWLHGVAHRVALKARADSAARRQREYQAARPDVLPPDDVTWGELRSAVDRELSLLPDRWRLPLILCYLEGRTQDEAASQLSWSKSTLRRRLEEARHALGSRLKGRGIVWPAALSAVLVADCMGSAAPAPGLVACTVEVAAGVAAGQPVTTAASPTAAALTEGAMKPMLTGKLKIAILFLAAVGLAAAGAGLIAHQLVAAMQQESQTDNAKPNKPNPAESADNQAKPADAELHVIGVSGAKDGDKGRVDVEVRATARPVVLVLTSYSSVEWHIKLAQGAQIEKAIVSGYFAQEIKGLPANVPLANQSYYPDDGSRRKDGWFYPDRWNTPQWREMVRRLNEMTGLPVASFQGESKGVSFIVDGNEGRNLGQKELKPHARAPKQPTPQELLAASANAELHVVGIYSPDMNNPGKPVDVEVRSTAKPVLLVLTSYMQAVWNVKRADGARIKAVIVGSPMPQEVEGIPAGVPVSYFCPDGSSYYFDRRRPQQDKESFFAYQWNTFESRRMVEKLNDVTGLLVSTFQGEYSGTSFVVDGARGRNCAQKERKRRPALPREPTPQELLAASADADLHVVSIYGTDAGNGAPVDVEVRPTTKPIVLALASYQSVLWNVKLAPGARVKAVLIGGYFEQEFEGIPATIPIVYRAYFPSLRQDYYYAYQWNTSESRRMVEKLNTLTGLLVSTFQGANTGTSFVVDGTRGSNFAQKERRPRPTLPREPAPKEFLAASADADLHVVSIYQPGAGNGSPVAVEVRSTTKPIVLALVSYNSVLWNVKIANGARVKAVVVGGYYEQEFEGIPTDIPLVYRAYFPSQKQGYFYGHEWSAPDCQGMVDKLNDMTGLLVSTFQGEYKGSSFVVDGTRGGRFAQKERKRDFANKQPKAEEDPLADVADIPAQERQAAGDADKRYFLIGPRKNARPPAEGYGLLVIVPGGDGSADFHPFVRRIYKFALSDRYVAAQPIAVRWTPDQQIVWPTKTNPVARMKFSTEEFVEAVVEDVAKKHKLNRTRVFTLSWSSSGPAAYALSLQTKRSVTGSFVAMSVFDPQFLPPLKGANGHAYYLYHSPADRVCPYRAAEEAKSGLAENGAKVRLETYEGGHGWRGNVYHDIRQGVEWLEKNQERAGTP
jgi:RNA polymerase sigma factor (sigma-70 family)